MKDKNSQKQSKKQGKNRFQLSTVRSQISRLRFAALEMTVCHLEIAASAFGILAMTAGGRTRNLETQNLASLPVVDLPNESAG
ncbi:MAG: hypothetical protein PHF37_07435 [Phycisphaerae bacterium]|nr:hypothetical protein [Phycisphaerae bacterium]